MSTVYSNSYIEIFRKSKSEIAFYTLSLVGEMIYTDNCITRICEKSIDQITFNQRQETLEREQRENWTLSSEAFHLEEKGYKQVGKKEFGEQMGLGFLGLC